MHRIFKHSVFWIAYLLFQSYIEFVWIKSSYADVSEWQRFWIALKVEFCLLIPKLLFAYVSSNILARFIKNRSIVQLGIGILGVLFFATVLYRLLSVYFILPIIYNEADSNPYSILRLLTTILDIVTVAGIFQVIRMFNQQLKTAQNEKLLIKSKLESELNYLKSQTNPHFLFNTLNNIYGLSKRNSELSSEAILKLSKVLRFTIYGSQKKWIPLSDELEIIRNYIEIEKLRYSNSLRIAFNTQLDVEGEITPLILLPLVENAFKHGASESMDHSFIEINCTLNASMKLHFNIKNSHEKQSEVELEKGIGLNNIERQLKMLYKEYTLNIFENENLFEVNLMINLNSYESL